jgi:hypothetical protein
MSNIKSALVVVEDLRQLAGSIENLAQAMELNYNAPIPEAEKREAVQAVHMPKSCP